MTEAVSVAALLADRDRLRAALKPFADFMRGFEVRTDSHCIASTALGALTVRDLRRARAAFDYYLDDDL